MALIALGALNRKDDLIVACDCLPEGAFESTQALSVLGLNVLEKSTHALRGPKGEVRLRECVLEED